MISIILPVYNVEPYLQACVDSVMASTYADFELLLIDDGSTDGSGNICDETAARDHRVKVFHLDNGGVANARNVGLRHARGEMIAFIDADDVISPVMLQALLDALMANDDCDFAMGRADAFMDDSQPSLATNPVVVNGLQHYNQRQYMSYLFRGNQFGYPVVWCKLFRRGFIGEEQFKSIPAEDIEWLTRLCVKMKKAVIVEDKLYGYRVRHDSITHENQNVNQTIVRRLDTFLMCLNDLPKECVDYRSWCLLYTYKMMLNTRYNARKTGFYSEVKSRSSFIYSQTADELKHCGLKWPIKAGLLCFYHQPWLYNIVYSAYARYYAATHY